MGVCGVDELQEEATNKSVGVNWKKEYSLRGMRYFFLALLPFCLLSSCLFVVLLLATLIWLLLLLHALAIPARS
jgi:hypothetical protein